MLVHLVVVVLLIGVLLYFITTFIPMDPKIKQLLVVVVVLVLVIWVLQELGLLGLLRSVGIR